MPDALIDGRAASSIPINDRGLLYGDHLFETIAFHGDSAPLWPHHMARLQRDGARLGIPVPAPGLLLGDCRRLLAGVARAVVRITITRGSGGRAYQPPDRPVARRIVQRRAWPQGLARQRRDGLRVVTSPIPWPGTRRWPASSTETALNRYWPRGPVRPKVLMKPCCLPPTGR